MRVILTGGAGFIGSSYLWKLNQMGVDQVLVVDNLDHDEKIKNLAKRKYRDFIPKEEFLEKLKSSNGKFDCDTVVHLGACTDTTESNKDYLEHNNFYYSQALCGWALGKNKKFLYASSAAIYGDGGQGYSDDDDALSRYKPLNLYGKSKHDFDLWLHQEKLTNKVIGFRYFNVFGPNEYHKNEMRSVVHKAYGQMKSTGKIRLFESHRPDYSHGNQKRDFVYVKDVLEIMGFFTEHPDRTGIYNLGTGQAHSFNELAQAIFSALKKSPKLEYFPMPEGLRDKYQYFTQAVIQKLRGAGWNKPFTPLEEAVRDYIQNHLQKMDSHL